MPGSTRTIPDKSVRPLWVNQGCPVPPPHHFKVQTLKAYAAWSKANVFVETGTYQGETTMAMAPHFSKVVSIELDQALASTAQLVFSNSRNVQILQGDSGLLLPKVLADINERCLFWLDGHNCGAKTGMSKDFGPTPIVSEMQAIFAHPVKDHVIIIDDQRYFTGEWGYPTVENLLLFVNTVRPDLIVDVCMDSIRIHREKL